MNWHNGLLFQTKADRQDNAEVEIARCTRGQYFGELALVTNKPRAASAYAIGEIKCLGKCPRGVCGCPCEGCPCVRVSVRCVCVSVLLGGVSVREGVVCVCP